MGERGATVGEEGDQWGHELSRSDRHWLDGLHHRALLLELALVGVDPRALLRLEVDDELGVAAEGGVLARGERRERGAAALGRVEALRIRSTESSIF